MENEAVGDMPPEETLTELQGMLVDVNETLHTFDTMSSAELDDFITDNPGDPRAIVARMELSIRGYYDEMDPNTGGI